MHLGWKVYKELINEVPKDITIDFVVVGAYLTLVEAAGVVGLSETVRDERRPRKIGYSLAGMSLWEAANLVCSWNLEEASIGLAALCAAFNTPKAVQKRSRRSPFQFLKKKTRGLRVGMTENIPYLNKLICESAQLSLFEEDPAPGSYPAGAQDALLGGQDLVLLGGNSIASKELPRILDLVKEPSKVMLAGFGIPMSKVLLENGVGRLAGLCVTEGEVCKEMVLGGTRPEELFSVCALCEMEAGK